MLMMSDAEGWRTAHDPTVTHCAHRHRDPVEPEVGGRGWGWGGICRSEGILVSFLYCSVIQQLEIQSHYWSLVRPDLCHRKRFYLFFFASICMSSE